MWEGFSSKKVEKLTTHDLRKLMKPAYQYNPYWSSSSSESSISSELEELYGLKSPFNIVSLNDKVIFSKFDCFIQ